ncbi:MAG: Trm112 family protein [Thermodesulfovibrionales bacterium]|nr:Trm112 family protein [Thermodesulfovibrionales bacterium]
MPLKPELLEILICPQCKGELEYDEGEESLLCLNCRLKYKIKNNIPIMLIEEAEKI